ncbi:DUF4180 domain-containing protein [Bdellovibrio sp. GT3]|uniref:DUF4180 domain-containing protein n=1 Tax=Bdellovibrio sp. GT3 TaxID=3136282 RepID=UPI0030F1E6D4
MNFQMHQKGNQKIAEVVGEGLFISSAADAFQAMMDISYEAGVKKMVFHQANMGPDFFDLKTKVLGELMQKAVNYQIQVAFVGSFSKMESKSLKDLIYESNKGHQQFFAEDLETALELLATHE